jgi:PAS domain S-box-containing protein
LKRTAPPAPAPNDRYRLLVEAVTDYALYMLDPAGLITSWNPGAERFKGYSSAEIIGEHFSKFYTEEDRASGLPIRALATAGKEGRYEGEGWRVRKDGTRFWASVVIDAIRADNGELIGFAKVTRDITERRNTQIALQAAQEQLMQSQKMEAIGQLTGGVAHDFNNLLMAVLSSLELLRKRLPEDPAIVRLLDNAAQAAERGASLTQRMLAFARRQELKAEAVDVVALVHNMADLLRRSLGKNVGVETHFPVGLSRARADANQLELALLNLAINARDAMGEGGVVKIAGSERTVATGDAGLPPGSYVVLTVSDTGHGMDAETLARAAEPFFTTKGPGKGTGLGLSLVHGVMAQLGGRLRLTSEVGSGTTAELWLPAAAPVKAKEAAPGSKAEPAMAQTARLRVLCVDDDALVLMNTGEMLRDLGHEVFEAVSGREALEIFARERIDIIITDQAMPQMTGLQLAEKIAERGPVPVIIASGYAELPRTASVVYRLDKPFNQRGLARAIAAAVGPGPA